jgi:flagellar hook-length control protein FliK
MAAPLLATPTAPSTPPAHAVPLQHAPRVVAQVLHLGSERGISHARLALRPAELGGIEVRLQSGPAGLAAHLVADSPQAARMLQQAADELRRSLAARDVTLLSLEVSTSDRDPGQPRPGAQAGAGDPSQGRPAGDARPQGGRGEPRDADPDSSPSPEIVLTLPDGVTVDVLA